MPYGMLMYFAITFNVCYDEIVINVVEKNHNHFCVEFKK
jgi:hypothetical protein